MSTTDPFQAAEYYGEFVEIAYLMYYGDTSNSLTPPPPQNLADMGYEIALYIAAVDYFIDDSTERFFGFVARNTKMPSLFVIAIRGTEGTIEWLIDFEVWPTEFTTIPAAGLVEYGFFSIFQTMRFLDPAGQEVSAADAAALLAPAAGAASPSVTVVGHSLGGALATMYALALLYNDPSLQPVTTLYTLASPALGDSTFAAFFAQYVQNSYRVWNEFDPVPLALPFYTHVDGGGNMISQTWEQFEAIASIPCEHELPTYLWLLNPNN